MDLKKANFHFLAKNFVTLEFILICMNIYSYAKLMFYP